MSRFRIPQTEIRNSPFASDPVDIWWIERPVRPRVSVRSAVIGSAVLLPLSAAAVLWALAVSPGYEVLWPWSEVRAGGAQVLLRYLFVLLVALLYALIRSKRLPQGVKIGGNVRWCRETLLAAMDRIAEGGFDEINQADDEAANDDEIMGAARGNGTQANVGH